MKTYTIKEVIATALRGYGVYNIKICKCDGSREIIDESRFLSRHVYHEPFDYIIPIGSKEMNISELERILCKAVKKGRVVIQLGNNLVNVEK